MTSVTEIKRAILGLTAAEYAELMTWLDELEGDPWDRQIEEDAKAGRLDALAAMVPGSALPERRWALGASLTPLSLPSKATVDFAGEVPRWVRAINGRWRPVEQVVDLWEVETEWWTPEPVNRRYWRLALADGGLLTVYRNLDTGEWFRQGY